MPGLEQESCCELRAEDGRDIPCGASEGPCTSSAHCEEGTTCKANSCDFGEPPFQDCCQENEDMCQVYEEVMLIGRSFKNTVIDTTLT